MTKTQEKPAESFDLVGAIMDYESGQLGDRETLDLFAHLIATGKAWSLQGSYGRTAQALIDDRWIDAQGNINQVKLETLQED